MVQTKDISILNMCEISAQILWLQVPSGVLSEKSVNLAGFVSASLRSKTSILPLDDESNITALEFKECS